MKGKGNILGVLHREQITDPIRSGSMGSACRCSKYDVINSHCAKTPCIEFYGVLVLNDTLGCFECSDKIKSDSWRLNDG